MGGIWPRFAAVIFSAKKLGKGTTGLKPMIALTCSGMIFRSEAYMQMPAPLPKPMRMTSFQPSPYSAVFVSMVSIIERPSNSKSCNMSRSSFSKDLRSRRYQEPSVTSGALRLNSCNPSPAGCWDQETDTIVELPIMDPSSLRIAFSFFGVSPIHTTSATGPRLFPVSSVMGRGPSGLEAATLWLVKRRLSHSAFNFSRSSSSFFFELCLSLSDAPIGRDASLPSPAFCNSSFKVGKISTTCALSDASAARENASLIASSPTLYSTVSSVNLFARTSLVMFSMTAIIFFAFADKACTQRAMLKPMKDPPHAAKRGGEISTGCATPYP
mmetsp:Transcript_25072/g.53117  ORF Transcript_25072/g.53117 Transcript_25072/m.53117 type:complete len:327 (-) Transcript_25072:885-1865(-)